MLIAFNGKRPRIGENVFIAPTAVIIGDVVIEDHASVWYNTVIRGDSDTITIGRCSNIQDNCTLHIDPGKPLQIGAYVTVGHNAVVHGCTIADCCLIGINATVLNGAHIHEGSIVAANALVREGQQVGPYHLVTGVPAALKKEFSEEVVETIRIPADVYVKKATAFATQARVISS